MVLLEEAKNLYPYRTLNALQTVGYKEIIFVFRWSLHQRVCHCRNKKKY